LSYLQGLKVEHDDGSPQFGEVILISESRLVKKFVNEEQRGRELVTFDVAQADASTLGASTLPTGVKFRFLAAKLISVNSSSRVLTVLTRGGEEHIFYDALCLCCGSRPKKLHSLNQSHLDKVSDRLIVLRDLTTVEALQEKLVGSKRLAVVGSGGIGLELVGKIRNCEITWIVKDSYIGCNYFDSGAAKFLVEKLESANYSPHPANVIRPEAYDSATEIEGATNVGQTQTTPTNFGPALGPNWSKLLKSSDVATCQSLQIIYQDEVADIQLNEDALEDKLVVLTKKGLKINCDLVAIAIGVEPNVPDVSPEPLKISDKDGGVLIDDQMRTSAPNIYAAGDMVSCDQWPTNDLWFQMRLWTQAKQMGFYAGRCTACHLAKRDPSLYFNFDCFTHCTTFFGQRLVLLGRYNGQGITEEETSRCEVIARVIKETDYIKLLLKENRIIGAVLIGDTGLEETIENLIHDQIDVSDQKDRLLDGSIDIADYFD